MQCFNRDTGRHLDTLGVRKKQVAEESKYVEYLNTIELGQARNFFLYDMYTCEDICSAAVKVYFIIHSHSASGFSSSKQCHLKINCHMY